MTRTITAPAPVALPPGNGYIGKLTMIEDGSGQFGDTYDWVFEVDGPDGPVEVSRRTSTKFGASAFARQYTEALIGRAIEPGETVDLDALIGRSAALTLSVNDKGYNVIESVAPAAASVEIGF